MLRLSVLEYLPVAYRAAAVLILALLPGLRRRTGRRFSAAIIAGFAAGLAVSVGFDNRAPRYASWTGLPASGITSFYFEAAADGSPAKGGRCMARGMLISVRNSAGAESGASGEVLVFTDSGTCIRKGMLFRAETSLETGQECSSTGFLSRPGFKTASCGASMLENTGWSADYYRLRADVLVAAERRCSRMDSRAGALFLALFTGCRDGLDAADSELFRRAGCSHVLALSGMHLGIITGMIGLLLRPLPGRRVPAAVSCVMVTLYLVLAGAGTSLLRAAVMFYCRSAYILAGRRPRSMDTIAAAFVIVAAADPYSFYGMSFRLSFLAVTGIILLSAPVAALLRPWLPSMLSVPLSVSIAAQAAVAPLLLSGFGVMYPAGMLAGLLIAPLAALLIWTGCIFLVSGAVVVSKLCFFIYKLISITAEYASLVSGLESGPGGWTAVIIFYTVLAILLWLSAVKGRFNGISLEL